MKISTRKIEIIQAQKNITNAAIAELSGISRQNYSTVKLRGTCRPTTAGKIARALGVEVEELLEEE